jgi:hypothetical protein
VAVPDQARTSLALQQRGLELGGRRARVRRLQRRRGRCGVLGARGLQRDYLLGQLDGLRLVRGGAAGEVGHLRARVTSPFKG